MTATRRAWWMRKSKIMHIGVVGVWGRRKEKGLEVAVRHREKPPGSVI